MVPPLFLVTSVQPSLQVPLFLVPDNHHKNKQEYRSSRLPKILQCWMYQGK
jgi:hypothetical protein